MKKFVSLSSYLRYQKARRGCYNLESIIANKTLKLRDSYNYGPLASIFQEGDVEKFIETGEYDDYDQFEEICQWFRDYSIKKNIEIDEYSDIILPKGMELTFLYAEDYYAYFEVTKMPSNYKTKNSNFKFVLTLDEFDYFIDDYVTIDSSALPDYDEDEDDWY